MTRISESWYQYGSLRLCGEVPAVPVPRSDPSKTWSDARRGLVASADFVIPPMSSHAATCPVMPTNSHLIKRRDLAPPSPPRYRQLYHTSSRLCLSPQPSAGRVVFSIPETTGPDMTPVEGLTPHHPPSPSTSFYAMSDDEESDYNTITHTRSGRGVKLLYSKSKARARFSQS